MSSPYSWEDTSGTDWGQTPGIDWSGSYDLPGLGGIGALSGGGGGSRELPGFLKGVKFLTDFTEKNFGPTGKYYNSASERAERRRTGSPSSSQIFDNIYSCTKEQVQKIKIEEEKIEEVFLSGPPCLNKLASTGFGEGSRNNALFNIAVYYKQANPDTWEDEIVKANMKYMNPPLSNNEVQQLIKSVSRKGYDKYRCKDAPINSVCQSGLCRTKKFGVGFGEEQMPILGNLTKYTSNPPQWFLNVGEKRIELKTEQLYSPALFAIACLDQANLVIPIPKPKDWKQYYLKPLLNNGLEEVEPLESLDPINQLTGLLQDWTTNRQSARTMEDIFNKLPYTDDNKEFTYFRMDDFYAFLKKNNWETDKIKTGNLLKRLQNVFVEEIRKNIKKQYSRLIKIKTMKKIEPSVSNITYNEEHF
jgi:hypothetical protein